MHDGAAESDDGEMNLRAALDAVYGAALAHSRAAQADIEALKLEIRNLGRPAWNRSDRKVGSRLQECRPRDGGMM
jgi:hypothetical protein